MLTVSCIIPTFQRPHLLMEALRSLQSQQLPDFEIIVVDNAADAEIDMMINAFNQTARIPARYLPEPHLGLHNARHTAAKKANGELLIFTDDDAIFDPAWLAEYKAAFESHPEMVAAGGPVHPKWEAPAPPWLTEYLKSSQRAGILSLMGRGNEFRLSPTEHFFGVNMAIRRKVLFEVGGFNPESFGNMWLGDGESGLNRKLWHRNLLIGYIPGALVGHYVPPERMTVLYFRQRMANQGASEMYTLYHQGIPTRKHLLKKIWKLLVTHRFWIPALLFHYGRTDRASLDAQLYAAQTQAHLKYLVRLLCQKDFRSLVLKTDWLAEE